MILKDVVETNVCDVHNDVMRWKHFHITDPLWGESIGYQWIPLTKGL